MLIPPGGELPSPYSHTFSFTKNRPSRVYAYVYRFAGRDNVHVPAHVHEKRMQLDHEKLDVDQVSLDLAVWAYELCRGLKGMDRHARDQLLRASQSITLNVAEGCGKVPSADRGRFLQIASGSARECGAVIDILSRCGVVDRESAATGERTSGPCRIDADSDD